MADTSPAVVNGFINNEPNVTSPEPLFSQESAENMTVKEGRTIRKAKRFNSITNTTEISNTVSSSGDNGNQRLLNNNIYSTGKLPYGKNSKKSRSGTRGNPKKGGAGGKGVWGKLGSELGVELDIPDRDDPNYDSDMYTDSIRFEKFEAPASEEEFNKAVTDLLKEYFEHGKPEEFLASFGEARMPVELRPRFTYLALSLAMQRHPHQRELTSRLLSNVCGVLLSNRDIELGMDMTIKDLSDLILDVPQAPEMVGRFIARAVADDIIAPRFVHAYKGRMDSEPAIAALAKAEILLSLRHAYTRLDNVWGVNGGDKPTKLLVKRMKLLLEEYLSSNDKTEAQRCLVEMDVPHFHHELVYQAVLLVIERSTGEACNRILALLNDLCSSLLLTVEQLTKGLKRIYQDMPDINLDVPNAYPLLERFVSRGYNDGKGFIPTASFREMPQKGRKRFVSEGDGGRVKTTFLPE